MFEPSSEPEVDRQWLRAMLATLDSVATCHDPAAISTMIEELLLDHLGSQARCWYVDTEAALLWSAGDDALEVDLGIGLAGEAAATGHPCRLTQARSARRYAPSVDGGPGPLLVVPVAGADREVHAVLVVGRAVGGPGFDASDQGHLEKLAELLAPNLSRLALAAELADDDAEAPTVEMAAGMYRVEALEALMRHRGHGELARIESPWVSWSYRVLVGLCALAVLYGAVVQVADYASGPALVRLGGRTEVAATRPGTVAEVLVAPGDTVAAGQALVALHDAEATAEVDRLELEFEQQLRSLLLDPGDAAARQAVTSLRGQRLRARALLSSHKIVAPGPATVSDVRVSTGHRVGPGDVLLALTTDATDPHVLALLPGEDRPRVCPGMALGLSIEGYPDARVDLIVEEVADDVVSPQEAARLLGPAVGSDLAMGGPVAVVRARIAAPVFVSDRTSYQYHDGMRGRAEVRVRSASLFETLVPALHRLPLPRSAGGCDRGDDPAPVESR